MKAIPEVRRPVGKTQFEIGLGSNILGEIAWQGEYRWCEGGEKACSTG
jgi:hypothetical protein